MAAHLFYVAMCLVLLELLFVQTPLALLGLGLGGICSVSALCIWGGLDLFGLVLLATYSSVFLFLSVIALYMGSAWELGG